MNEPALKDNYKITAMPLQRSHRRLTRQAFKRQAGEDKVTITLIVICVFALGAVFAAQAGLRWNF